MSASRHRHYGEGEMPVNRDQYEELIRDVQCPTCRGSGRVPKDSEEELVALIPLKDKRLRPRRTWLWVSLTAIIFSITAAALIFFLLPRTVYFVSDSPILYPNVSLDIDHEKSLFLPLEITFNASNDNYFSVKLHDFRAQILYDNIDVKASRPLTSAVYIPLRSTSEVTVRTNVTTAMFPYLEKMCFADFPPSIHMLTMHFIITVTTEYFDHSENSTLDTYQRVSCYFPHPSSPTPTLSPAYKTTTKHGRYMTSRLTSSYTIS